MEENAAISHFTMAKNLAILPYCAFSTAARVLSSN
jgi:hypothetical protein